jgi:hypothetical protein
LADTGGEFGQHRRLEQQAQIEFQAQGFAQAGNHLGGADGVAAEQEEVIIASHLRHLQLFAPDRGDLLLQV